MSINTLIPQIISAQPEEQVNLFREFIRHPETRHLVFQAIGNNLSGAQISSMQRMNAGKKMML